MFSRTQARGSPRWIVAFLGNPGQKYELTRHNAGFFAAEALRYKTGIKLSRIRFKAVTAVEDFAGEKVLFMKPQTFMNLSGEAVGQAAGFYKIPPERVVVVVDDIALPPGKLRVKRKGSDGGHNGLKSIAAHLKTDEYIRIKIGVGSPSHPDYDQIDWVIGKLPPEDLKLIDEAAGRAVEALELLIKSGVDAAMNKFN